LGNLLSDSYSSYSLNSLFVKSAPKIRRTRAGKVARKKRLLYKEKEMATKTHKMLSMLSAAFVPFWATPTAAEKMTRWSSIRLAQRQITALTA
jgi:hypothetical protein